MGHSHSRIQSGHKPPIFSQLGRASSDQINLQIPTRTSSICQYQDPPAQQCTETQNTESMPPLPGYTSKTKRRRFWKPTVLISLQDRSFEDSIMYKHLRQTLERHATLKYAERCRNLHQISGLVEATACSHRGRRWNHRPQGRRPRMCTICKCRRSCCLRCQLCKLICLQTRTVEPFSLTFIAHGS